MRRLLTFVTLLTQILLFAACEEIPTPTQDSIDVKSKIGCTFDSQVVEIEYKLSNQSSNVTATADVEWITDIDYSEFGKIKLNVSTNYGDERNATISISASGYATTTVTLTQMEAPGDSSHTLMVYFFGTSLSRYFNTNINDIKTAIESGALGDNNRVIYLYQYGTNSAYIREICYDHVSGKCIERELEKIKITPAHITIEDISGNIAKMAEYAPADRYGIVFAGHGQAWIPRALLNGSGSISTYGTTTDVWQAAIGAEVTRAFGESNVQVDTAELAEAIDKSGVELDYILFDACFMSNIEAIYDFRNVANYIIASPCEIMGRGFPYHHTLPYLFAANGKSSDIKGAAESYYLYYRDEYESSARCGSVAVYNCAEIEALAEATRELVRTAKSEYNIANLQTYEGQTTHQFYDFGQWANVVATDETLLADFNAQFDNTIIAKYTLPTFYSAYGSFGTYTIDVNVFSGVTTSAPSMAYPQAWRDTNWYKYVWEQ